MSHLSNDIFAPKWLKGLTWVLYVDLQVLFNLNFDVLWYVYVLVILKVFVHFVSLLLHLVEEDLNVIFPLQD